MSRSPHLDAAELHLLFAKGKRPDRIAIRSFVSRQQAVVLSHDPGDHTEAHDEPLWPGQQLWLELLRDGLTFDMCGLSPGPQSAFPEIAHRFDLPDMPQPDGFDVMTIVPGPHLAAAGNTMPVMKAMLALVCDLARHFADLAAVCWAPSSSAIGRRFFESVTTAWLEGGPFPALGLTAFVVTPSGALKSVGLDFWIGQELQIEPPQSADKVAATRLGIRIINQLVIVGQLETSERITAPDGTRLVMHPSPDRKLIRVWRE